MRKLILIVMAAFIFITLGDVVRADVDTNKEKTVRVFPYPLTTGSYKVGSGFFIEGGRVITNEHVVDDTKTFLVADGAGHAYKATLIAKDAIHDLAILKTEAVDHDFFELAERVFTSQNVSLIGSAPGGEEFTLKSGSVTYESIYVNIGTPGHVTSDGARTMMDIEVAGGFSGGPVYDKDGAIVGVTEGGGEGMGSVAVRLDDLKSFIADNPIPIVPVKKKFRLHIRNY